MAQQGARHIVILSRQGDKSKGAPETMAAIKSLGAVPRAYACDASDRDDLQRVLTEIAKNGPPLRGVLQAAMILRVRSTGKVDELGDPS